MLNKRYIKRIITGCFCIIVGINNLFSQIIDEKENVHESNNNFIMDDFPDFNCEITVIKSSDTFPIVNFWNIPPKTIVRVDLFLKFDTNSLRQNTLTILNTMIDRVTWFDTITQMGGGYLFRDKEDIPEEYIDSDIFIFDENKKKSIQDQILNTMKEWIFIPKKDCISKTIRKYHIFVISS